MGMIGNTPYLGIVNSGNIADGSVTPQDLSLYTSGTANGVAYLNGSKVLTTGSALTFDGNTLKNDTASTTAANIRIENGSFNRVGSFALTNNGVQFDSFDQSSTSAQRSYMWLSGGSEQMRLTSTGLGIGVTPSAWGSSFKAVQIGRGTALWSGTVTDATFLSQNAYYDGTNFRYLQSTYASYYSSQLGQHLWYTAPSGTAGNAISFTQAMTLDASGNLLVGTTSSSSKLHVSAGNQVASTITNTNADDLIAVRGNSGGSSSTAMYVMPMRFGDTTLRGSIYWNGSSVSYNTSSDYRLKDNIQPMQNALAVVEQLNPVTYNWKADGSAGQGFIAHELQAVVPDCVTGEKDAVDAEGNPVYQGIDTSFLVATLTAAIQEQQAIINAQQAALETLTARVSALENKENI